jgi:hypothetical protein
MALSRKVFVVFLALSCLLQPVSLVWVVDVLLTLFADVTVRTLTGDCCQPACADSCENYITVCVSKYKSTDESCYNSVTTEVFRTTGTPDGWVHSKMFAMNENLGNNVTNPISVTIGNHDFWEGSFGLTLNITINNYSLTLYYVNATLSVDWNKTEIAVTDATYSKFLYFSWRVRCAENYYGDHCETHCDNSTGHYNCSVNGTKICLPGYANTNLNCATGRSQEANVYCSTVNVPTILCHK